MRSFFDLRHILIPAFVLFLAAPARSQQEITPACKDACLEKETTDFTQIIVADGDRLKIGILAEDITWSDDYRRAAIDVIQNHFPDKFVYAGDQSLGVLMLYISGTPVVSNGAQYVNVRLQFYSSALFLPEDAKTIFDAHLAKLGHPIRMMRGELVFAEGGHLLPPIGQGTPFELWHQLNIQTIRETVQKVLDDFSAAWDKAGEKKQ